VLKIEQNMTSKLNRNDSFYISSNFSKIPEKSLKRVKSSNLETKSLKVRALYCLKILIWSELRIIPFRQQIFSQSDPALIRQFSKKLQSDPILVRLHLALVLIQSDPVLLRAHL